MNLHIGPEMVLGYFPPPPPILLSLLNRQPLDARGAPASIDIKYKLVSNLEKKSNRINR